MCLTCALVCAGAPARRQLRLGLPGCGPLAFWQAGEAWVQHEGTGGDHPGSGACSLLGQGEWMGGACLSSA